MPVILKKPPTIQFKDNLYSAEAIQTCSKSGPMIEISSDQLHDYFFTLVSLPRDMPDELQKQTPVFAKYEGKYVLLLGLAKVMERYRSAGEGNAIKLKGRLVSNPMLKRCVAA